MVTDVSFRLLRDELRALRTLKRKAKWFTAGIGFKVHPQVLRHAVGFVLANKGTDTPAQQTYLGHRNVLAADLSY